MNLPGRKKTEEKIRNPQLSSEAEGYAFRRSRTLTGSASGAIRSAGESRAQIKSPRLKEHELKKHRNLLASGLVGVVLLVGVMTWLVSSLSAGTPEISSMSQVTTGIDTPRYQKIINDYYAKRPLERFRFSLDETTLLSYVQNAAPEVSRVTVTRGDGIGGSVVALGFREPLIGWQIKGSSYFIDGDGAVFQKNYYGSPSVTVQDASGINPDEGVIASNRFLAFLGQVVAGTNKSGLGTVKSVVLPAGTSREVDMMLEGRKYTIKLQMDREPSGQLADVTNALRYLDQKQLSPDYVDVRVPSRAYYR